ncbi:P2X purinoceptor 7-like [Saccostrea cucullata]|uniref:P2X purinoceptor 7-like n=1 Tax=Saccostrea cuccullata TaxID=36930 RepID=UPI002ED1DA3D
MEDRSYDIDDIPLVMDVQPYMFEPPANSINGENSATSSEESDDEARDNPGHRLNGTIWCDCGSCEVMRTTVECICCTEISAVDNIRESSDLECITNHQTFIDNCLNLRVLEVSLYDYIQSEGPIDDNEPINEIYRYVAYRRFVLWIWQRLGKGNRKVLPACVVSKIRNTFQSEHYTGFQYPRPT